MSFEVGLTYFAVNDTTVAAYFCIALPSPSSAATHESIGCHVSGIAPAPTGTATRPFSARRRDASRINRSRDRNVIANAGICSVSFD